jgi:hypothetical protein
MRMTCFAPGQDTTSPEATAPAAQNTARDDDTDGM